jgi:hypothetical protein
MKRNSINSPNRLSAIALLATNLVTACSFILLAAVLSINDPYDSGYQSDSQWQLD